MGWGSGRLGAPPFTTTGTPDSAPEAIVAYTLANKALAAPLEACPSIKALLFLEYIPSPIFNNSIIWVYTSGIEARGWFISSPSDIDFLKIGTPP